MLREETPRSDGSTTIIKVAASNIAVALGGDGTPGSALVSLTGGSGEMLITRDGLAASVSATVTVNPSLGITFTGRFGLSINNGTKAVHEVFDVGGQPLVLDLPAGKFLRISGDNIQLGVGGFVLTGSFRRAC